MYNLTVEGVYDNVLTYEIHRDGDKEVICRSINGAVTPTLSKKDLIQIISEEDEDAFKRKPSETVWSRTICFVCNSRIGKRKQQELTDNALKGFRNHWRTSQKCARARKAWMVAELPESLTCRMFFGFDVSTPAGQTLQLLKCLSELDNRLLDTLLKWKHFLQTKKRIRELARFLLGCSKIAGLPVPWDLENMNTRVRWFDRVMAFMQSTFCKWIDTMGSNEKITDWISFCFKHDYDSDKLQGLVNGILLFENLMAGRQGHLGFDDAMMSAYRTTCSEEGEGKGKEDEEEGADTEAKAKKNK